MLQLCFAYATNAFRLVPVSAALPAIVVVWTMPYMSLCMWMCGVDVMCLLIFFSLNYISYLVTVNPSDSNSNTVNNVDAYKTLVRDCVVENSKSRWELGDMGPTDPKRYTDKYKDVRDNLPVAIVITPQLIRVVDRMTQETLTRAFIKVGIAIHMARLSRLA